MPPAQPRTSFLQLRPTSIEKEIFPAMAQDGQLYAMELQGKALCTVQAASGVLPALPPSRWELSSWLCPHRLLDGHWAAKGFPYGHVHVPASAAGSAPREATLGAWCRRECAGGKCQPPAQQPWARYELSALSHHCPHCYSQPVPSSSLAGQVAGAMPRAVCPSNPGMGPPPSRTPVPRLEQTVSSAPT